MNLSPTFSKPLCYPKGWGEEIWIANNNKYCGKILNFNNGASFSMHFHIKKDETWYVTKGSLKMEYFDLSCADRSIVILREGDVVHLEPNIPHKLTALEDSSIFEVSTQHMEEDSYRIEKGSSQL